MEAAPPAMIAAYRAFAASAADFASFAAVSAAFLTNRGFQGCALTSCLLGTKGDACEDNTKPPTDSFFYDRAEETAMPPDAPA